MKSLHEIFFQMEEEQNLFTLQLADGTYYWDIIRREVFAALHALSKGSTDYPKHKFRTSVIVKIKDFLKMGVNELTLYYQVRCNPEFLFVTFQRPKQDSLLADYITDHLYESFSDNSVCIEHINKQEISYRKIALGRRTRIPPVKISMGKMDSDISKVDKTISEAISKYFEFPINICDVAYYPIQAFKQTRDYYRRLFSKILPKSIVCTNDGSLKGLFFAAQEANISTIELQHGASPGSILWTYPKAIEKFVSHLTVPSAFLTLSDYWKNTINYPVKLKSTIGNDNLYQVPISGDDNIIIVANLMSHKVMIDLTLELANLYSERKIYYKLHPQQFEQKSKVINEFSRKSNIIVVTNELNDFDLFENCNHVIAVRSTLIYAALQAGKNVYIFKRHNYNWDSDIFKYTELFDNATELKNYIDNASKKKSTDVSKIPVFFQKFDSHQFMRILNNIVSY